MTTVIETDVPIGKIKSFGKYGPQYEIIREIRRDVDKTIIEIRMVATGEEAEYELSKAMADPDAL